MKILSVDTANDVCGVSILEDTKLLCRLDTNTGRTHSENLMPMIQNIFMKTNLSLKDIDLLVCDKGPGSFTGIRIGIATIKAFTDTLSIPSIGISSLEALAYNIKNEGLICSLIDCKHDSCYYAMYELKNHQYTEILAPDTNTIDEILNILQASYQKSIIFVGNGALLYKEKIMKSYKSFTIANDNDNILNSYSLGLAGLYQFTSCNVITETTNTQTIYTENLLPLYLKKPQAQRQLEEKLKKEL